MAEIKKLKACVLASFFWPVSGDVEDYPYNIAKMLKDVGHEVDVFTPDVWPDGKRINRPNKDEYRGIKIFRFKSYANLSWFVKLWFPFFKKKYDIVHCCGGYRHPSSYFAMLTRKKAKFFLSPFYPIHARKNKIHNYIAKFMDRTIGRWLISSSDICFAETLAEKKWLESLGARRVEILPNPLPDNYLAKRDAQIFKKKYNIKGQMLFSLGRHVPIKNFEELIKTAKEIDATYVIGGGWTEYTKECMSLAEKLGVSQKIIWPGFMNAEEKLSAMSACDVFVLTSKRESLGNVVIEAMSQGAPIIATDGGGIPEVVPDSFCLYKSGDTETLIKKIKLVLGNKKFAGELGRRGFEKAKKYSRGKICVEYAKIIGEICKN